MMSRTHHFFIAFFDNPRILCYNEIKKKIPRKENIKWKKIMTIC